MARIFITGSADGLGHLAAKELVQSGHQVVLHARNTDRGREALQAIPGAETVLIGDLSSIEEIKKLAAEVNALGHFDTIIHNAGVYNPAKNQSKNDFHQIMVTVNTLAPYLLTALIEKPKRLIYMTSGLHLQGDPQLRGLTYANGDYSALTYSDTKLHDVIISLAVARLWTNVYSNTVNPGWVPTKMGGSSASDDLEEGFRTQVWLAASTDKEAQVSGRYFHHKKEVVCLPEAHDHAVQNNLLEQCAKITGVFFPGF